MRVIKWERSRSHLSFYKPNIYIIPNYAIIIYTKLPYHERVRFCLYPNGSKKRERVHLLPLFVKITIPSKSDYRAVFRGFVFYAVNFIAKRLSSIVGRSGSLTAHIINRNEKVCTFSTLAILQEVIFCNTLKTVIATY